MLGRRTAPGADHRADDERGLGLAAKHVTELGGLVEDLVEADAEEIGEHQLGHRPQPSHRRPGGRTHDRRLGDRRVDHPRFAEFGEEALGHPEDAAIGVALALGGGTAGDVLADYDDSRVAAHFLGKRFVERLADRFLWYRGGSLIKLLWRIRSALPPRRRALSARSAAASSVRNAPDNSGTAIHRG